MAVVTATRNFVRNLGASLGLAVAGTVINNSVAMRLTDADTGLSTAQIAMIVYSPTNFLSSQDREGEIREILLEGYLRGFRIVFLIGAGLAVLSFFMAWFLMPELGLKRDDDQRLKGEGKDKTLRNREG